MLFFKTEDDLVERLREDESCIYDKDKKLPSDNWLINNAFEQGWVSNFNKRLDGFLYFETKEESDEWFNKQELF